MAPHRADAPADGPAHEQARSVAARLAAPVERVFRELESVADGFAKTVEAAAGAGRRPAVADLAALRRLADEALDADPLFLGVGVVVEPGLLSDADRYLEWQQRAAGGAHEPLLLDVDPDSDDPYDYPQMEWFRVPHDEGRRAVGGPYFDFHGADRFALTFALPVVAGGRFAGVAGGDVPLGALEADLLPLLRQVPTRAALLNHENRVVTANTPKFTTGARVRPAEAGDDAEVVPVVPDLGWTLLVAP